LNNDYTYRLKDIIGLNAFVNILNI
jgi:hypothetical protein